ncbi:hypothetical protein F511_47653 [Dorcoceras hygrometricum]|uniref:Uncharacterized protein n=1 Tax=Dorcoceras hygrometricum TaxID=472368 RepID=A0A2Z6ZWX3_9LAMI|nr:hypothetical protein F511_47653 [Dorcoceras hygrometricum]
MAEARTCCASFTPLRGAVARGVRAAAAAAIFVVVAPPAGCRSGDVVTAGLNSSRVWFGPVPGSP